MTTTKTLYALRNLAYQPLLGTCILTKGYVFSTSERKAGAWFKRGYDQALMLPLLYYCYKNKLKACYLPRICYIYNHKGSSTPKTEHTGGKLEESIATFLRHRGYIE